MKVLARHLAKIRVFFMNERLLIKTSLLFRLQVDNSIQTTEVGSFTFVGILVVREMKAV